MIRYAVSSADLNHRVDARGPNWRANAATRTAAFIQAGKFNETSSIWADIKPVFMDVQFNKCVFCERLFEDEAYGSIEHDLEHFRPKNAIKKWPSGAAAGLFDFSTGAAGGAGYFWLAYDLGNYAASCKVCNSTLKSNAFPIGEVRGVSDDSIAVLKTKEKPFLCYPIGKADDDPEALIEFVGTAARPVAKSGHKRRRAEVIIEFFKLNARDLLHFERAQELVLLGVALKKRDAGHPKGPLWVETMIADNRRHAACKRSFVDCWETDKPLAEKLLGSAEDVTFEAQPPAEGDNG